MTVFAGSACTGSVERRSLGSRNPIWDRILIIFVFGMKMGDKTADGRHLTGPPHSRHVLKLKAFRRGSKVCRSSANPASRASSVIKCMSDGDRSRTEGGARPVRRTLYGVSKNRIPNIDLLRVSFQRLDVLYSWIPRVPRRGLPTVACDSCLSPSYGRRPTTQHLVCDRHSTTSLSRNSSLKAARRPRAAPVSVRRKNVPVLFRSAFSRSFRLVVAVSRLSAKSRARAPGALKKNIGVCRGALVSG
ncbi:hypothetical protein EVAR_9039_1 [Eumeta japonica]|uniref:Uncharacterized protein n=1 Tax=Eumeta variegata TaxID=151549 RepID=A0A4C1TW06_EUMVA|nr:hypothetical protein EVAR_9039_1 [Eumeta japonica]